MWEIAGKWSVLLIAVSVMLSLGNQKGEPKKGLPSDSSDSISISPSSSLFQPLFLSNTDEKLESNESSLLEYDFYRDSCPQAEKIIRSTLRQLYEVRSNVAPALLRLVFHDCFIQGCDASVLLDAINGIESEKEAPPNETLKGFDLIEIIKSKVEQECPGTVSCSDILVLAAREGVVLAGGPFYPLNTGRRDSDLSFREIASNELPSPNGNLYDFLMSFSDRGFDERETVSLLGAHSVGMIHCKFFTNRLYNFAGTGGPDPSLDLGFLDLMKSRCNNTSSSSDEPGMEMDYDGAGSGFGTQYYRSLEKGRGILYTDQQLMASEETKKWVHAYASDDSIFRKDFALAMMKLSSLEVLTPPLGHIRLNCSRPVVHEGQSRGLRHHHASKVIHY